MLKRRPMPNETAARDLPPRHVVIGITGATGAIYALRALQVLHNLPAAQKPSVHLVISKAGLVSCQYELGLGRRELGQLANVSYGINDIAAPIASGSFPTSAMIVLPCSMKTLAAIALGLSDNLIARAADVMLKERRPLVLVTREAPLNNAHLKNMLAVSEMGGIIFPPVASFYQRPTDVSALIDHTVGRILDQVGIATDLAPPWLGLEP